MAKHLSLGKQGELLARKYLQDNGYKILSTNFRHRKFELDLVALHNEILVFVEVKTRSTDFFGAPEEAVDFTKEKHIADASEAFMLNNNSLHYIDIRFDIIAIIMNKSKTQIKHIEDAFFPKNF